MSLAVTRFHPPGNQCSQLRTMFEEPIETFRKSGKLIEDAPIQHLYRKNRDETDHRAQLQRYNPSFRRPQRVIEKAVLVVPQALTCAADIIHGSCDRQEMFKELRGEILVDWVEPSGLEGDAHEIERIHSHPCCAVGLVDRGAVRKRIGAIERADIVQT